MGHIRTWITCLRTKGKDTQQPGKGNRRPAAQWLSLRKQIPTLITIKSFCDCVRLSHSTGSQDTSTGLPAQAGMERSRASVISAHFITCLAFAGLVGAGKPWLPPEVCRTLLCDKVTFDANAYKFCVEPFNQTMANTEYQLRCPWPSTRRDYVKLILCLEDLANSTCCKDVSYRHYLMLDIHKVYFSMCSYMQDPGIPILLMLILPCVIIPFFIPFICQYFKLQEYRLPNN
ncbi:uncharacterized protein LOC127964608 [Carassius gibelio]|uniref:uncharacterized protein LOC127964608 n=1 Tax=Carassius gibelio TaxID=101364 RepID=UPI00227992CA|nr:uncharacterized protein LOC127964608 [Carassius gibelio]